MAFKINERSETSEWVETGEALWLTSDGDRLVQTGDPDARSLFASEGKRVSREDAERFGLVKSRAKQGDKQRKPEGDKAAKAEADKANATDTAVELAAEHGLDLASLAGSGKDGRVTKADVEAAVAGS